jgi:hypothetical protein
MEASSAKEPLDAVAVGHVWFFFDFDFTEVQN